MFTFLLWCILFILCWPLALLALVAYPFIWLLLLPFRIIGVAVHGVLEVIYLAINQTSVRCFRERPFAAAGSDRGYSHMAVFAFPNPALLM